MQDVASYLRKQEVSMFPLRNRSQESPPKISFIKYQRGSILGRRSTSVHEPPVAPQECDQPFHGVAPLWAETLGRVSLNDALTYSPSYTEWDTSQAQLRIQPATQNPEHWCCPGCEVCQLPLSFHQFPCALFGRGVVYLVHFPALQAQLRSCPNQAQHLRLGSSFETFFQPHSRPLYSLFK
jgi:hypothetical protein